MPDDFFSFVTRGEFKKALRCLSFETAARSLAQQCRYNGTTSQFYSVAQHCVLISERWPADDPRAVWGLLHDLHECVIGDIIKPVRDKLLWQAGEYWLPTNQIEGLLLHETQKRFGLDPIPQDVLLADRLIAVDEMLLLFRCPSIHPRARRLGVTIEPVGPKDAETLFVERARKLGVDGLF